METITRYGCSVDRLDGLNESLVGRQIQGDGALHQDALIRETFVISLVHPAFGKVSFLGGFP